MRAGAGTELVCRQFSAWLTERLLGNLGVLQRPQTECNLD